MSNPNRYICSALEEMRKCCKTLNFAMMKSQIEEVQVMANRMEEALYDKDDLYRAREEYKKLEDETKKLRKKKKKLLNQIEDLEEKRDDLKDV